MAVAVASIGHEDRVSLVEHLQELRGRLIISLAAVAIAFVVCMWQNHALLNVINKPLSRETQKQVKAGSGPLGATYTVQQSARVVASELQTVVGALQRPGSGASAATRASLAPVEPRLHSAIKSLSAGPQGNKPVTLGIGEPFTTTIGIALIFALILALPIVLYELYGFLLPALSPEQRSVTTPLMLAIPFLFVAGVMFGYFVVLPAAVRFFQNFNSGQFNVLVQANQYYHDGARLPGPRRHPRGDTRGGRDDAPAAPQPPLRDPRVRRGRGVSAGGCGHADPGDRSAVPVVRAECSDR
jgi:sec-independent protein translocase protein TatC